MTQEHRRTGRPLIRISASSIGKIRQSQRIFATEPLFDNWDPGAMRLLAADRIAPDSALYQISRDLAVDVVDTSSIFVMKLAIGDTCRGLLTYYYEFAQDELALLTVERTNFQLIANRILQAFYNTNMHLNEVTEEAARREWLKVISHQVIAPLNALIGHAERLQRYTRRWQRESASFGDLPDNEIDGWTNALDSISWTAEWACRIIRNLAWISNLDSGKQTIPEQEFILIADAAAYISGIALLVQRMAQDSGLRKVHVVQTSFNAMNGRLKVYPSYFQQAMLNILDNAVKYADKRTDIFIEGETTPDHGKIMVSNFGARLKAGDCQQIFENGFRSNEARQRYATGTGIGLAVTRSIVQLHGGKLSVEPSINTEQGWKTTFTISLPLEIH